MKKILLSAVAALMMATPALADYTFVVPQKPGSGTGAWTESLLKELSKYLDEPAQIRYLPGANDIPGFNKFHNELRFDEKTVMVSHGGNGVSYLVDDVDYNYYDYDPIAMMNLTIVNAHLADTDPYADTIKFAAGSGMSPDVMGHIMLIGGPGLTVEKAKDIFSSKYTYVKGMKGQDRRLAFQRGELNVTRENPLAYKKHVEGGKAPSKLWFSHGVFDKDTGKVVADPNFPGGSFQEVFEAKWGTAPSGEFYDAYLLVRNWRDVMQKALWVNKGNPNAEKLRNAVRAMLANADSVKALEKRNGKYGWFIGADMGQALDSMKGQITPATLKNLVDFLKYTVKETVYK
jgi:hypothetical protein